MSFYDLNNKSSATAPGTLLGTEPVLNNGTTSRLTAETPPLAIGSYTITAVYSGDSNFSGGQTMALEAVNQASTHTVVRALSNPGVAGASVTFTATVSSAAPNWQNNGTGIAAPTGTVSFSVGGGALVAATFDGDSGDNAIYSYTTTISTAGSYAVAASYGGDANYVGSSSRPLNYQVVSAATAGTGTITTSSTSVPSTTSSSNVLQHGLPDGRSGLQHQLQQRRSADHAHFGHARLHLRRHDQR